MLHRPSKFLLCSTTTLSLLLHSVSTALDEDNDGMSDVWQKVYNIASFDTISDPDKDGRTNLEEARVGTNPNDKNDYFRTIHYQIKPDVGTVDLTWRSLEDRSYNVQESRDLVSWNNLHQMRGIVGDQSSVSLNIPTIPGNDNFESRLATSTLVGQTLGHNK